YLTSLVITSRTRVCGPLPSATPRTAMSRSVIMPTSLSLSPTGNRPASISRIMRAASWMVWSGPGILTSRVMHSLTFMTKLRERWEPLAPATPQRKDLLPAEYRYRPSVCFRTLQQLVRLLQSLEALSFVAALGLRTRGEQQRLEAGP